MNTPSTINPPAIAASGAHLLDAIKSIKASVGDGLNDFEFTRFLQNTALPIEEGFTFLCYSDKFLTFSVPAQDLANWHPETGWINPQKELIARAIAKKYDLTLCEPPDALHSYADFPNHHHHLEFVDRRETVITAHPEYLKLRLFSGMFGSNYSQSEQRPLSISPDLLKELSALYKP